MSFSSNVRGAVVVLITAGLVLCCCHTIPAQQGSANAQASYKAGLAAQEKGQYAFAASQFAQACTSDPAVAPYLIKAAEAESRAKLNWAYVQGLRLCDPVNHIRLRQKILTRFPKDPVSMEILWSVAEEAETPSARLLVLERIRRDFAELKVSSSTGGGNRGLQETRPDELYSSIMRDLFGLYLKSDGARALELAEQMASRNPADKSWSAAAYLQRLIVKGWPNGVVPRQILEQTQMQLAVLAAQRHDLGESEITKSYLTLAKQVAETPVAPLISALYKFGESLKKSKQQVDDDVQRMRTDNAKKFTDFELSTYGSSKVKLADLRGKVVFINFWSPFCKGCVKELPYLQRLVQRYKEQSDKFVLLTINTIPSQDDSAQLLIRNAKFTFTVLKVPAEDWARETLGVELNPASYILDSEGRVIYHSFYILNTEQFETVVGQIDSLLTRTSAGTAAKTSRP